MFCEAFTEQELFQIYDEAEQNKWPGLIGKKPDGFDELPEKRHWWSRKRSKRDYTYPICRLVEDYFGDVRMEYHRRKKFSKKTQFLMELSDVSHGMRTTDLVPLALHISKIRGWS